MKWYVELQKLRALDWKTKGLLRIKLDESIKEIVSIRNYMIANNWTPDNDIMDPELLNDRHFMVDYNGLDHEWCLRSIGWKKDLESSDEVKIMNRIEFINYYGKIMLNSNFRNRKEGNRVREIRIKMNQLYKEAIGD